MKKNGFNAGLINAILNYC